MICLWGLASVRSATQRGPFFCLRAHSYGTKLKPCGFLLNGLLNGRRIMPLYFFHLSFGDRTVPDEEGVELSNRSAAREEALAVIRDLADPDVAGDPRRWASWFLQVADEAGQFLRMPIGRPALEVVTADAAEPRAEEPGPPPMQPAATAAAQPSAASRGRSAMLVQELSAVRKRTEQLLQHNQWLRDELSSLCLASEGIRARTSRLVLLARLAGSPADDSQADRAATKPARRSPPHLVLLPGR
jgi:hypothetical protein